MEGGGGLPDLPALVHGLERRRRRRPAGHPVEARLHRGARASTSCGCARTIPARTSTTATTSATTAPCRRCSARWRTSTPWWRAEGARHPPHRRPRGQPHLGPASLVRAEPECARRSRPGLLHLAGRQGRRAAQQLPVAVRRPGLDAGRRHRPVLPAPLRAPAARPQLGRAESPRRGARHHALLARPGRVRLPAGRHHLHLEATRPAGPDAGRTPRPHARLRRRPTPRRLPAGDGPRRARAATTP